MISSKKVMVTSAVMFAFIDRNDPKHQQASAFLRYFALENFHVYTTLFSIDRTYNDLRHHMSYSVAKDFIRAMFVGNTEVLYPDDNSARLALKLISNETSQGTNFTQAMINILADKHQIPQICSFEYSSFYFGIKLFTLPY